MASFKEIVTKAVIGKAKKTSSNKFSLEPEEIPNTVLGCWVINHKFSGSKGDDGKVLINGSFDVNVWYSYNEDRNTAVTTKNFTYSDVMSIPLKEEHNLKNASEIIVRCLHQPTVSSVNIESNTVVLDIEKELGVEIVGDTKVKVSVEDDEDDYVELFDDNEIELDDINENYLDDNSNQ